MRLLIYLPQLVAERKIKLNTKDQEHPKPNRAPVRHNSGGLIEILDKRRDDWSSGVREVGSDMVVMVQAQVQGARCKECARQVAGSRAQVTWR